MTMTTNEPTLETIEDYNGNESIEKRKIIWIVIISGLLIGAIFTYFKANSQVNNKIFGTTDIVQIYK